MSSPTADDVRSFVLTGVGDALAAKGLKPGDVPDSFDLLVEGVIDSFGIVELIMRVEQEYGFELDLSDLDADDLTRVGPLSRYVQERADGGR